ncbi:metallophosphoesterase family protein [Paenibacillus alkalitolerans]|uniref:metallophosphoesterase family protein n=1 Tax=Paenibacillus alkalitolerans TaxID=2799335 RepID=UPI0018F642C0|nr:metallophosphoesterase family protein [Paenibacillus alkalitolerans]
MSGGGLKFRADGTFTIVQFTDMHFGGGGEMEQDGKTAALVERVIATERPDLVVLTGDMIWSAGVTDPASSFRRAIAPVTASGVPWAAVFGNHDAEQGVTREELLAIQLENSGCLTQSGPADVSGTGNYALTVGSKDSGSDAAVFYFLDSGAESPEPVGGYEWLHTDQVYWYTSQSRRLNAGKAAPLPALAFFHIPLPEYETVWRLGKAVGIKSEDVCCPKINSGMFAAMVETGDVMGVFVGHDHDNDYCGTLHGVKLCYGRVTGYNCYGGLRRGARVVRMHEGRRSFVTWLRLDNGEAVQFT